MEGNEFNKIAAGVLSGLLFMFGVPEFLNMVGGKGHGGGDHGHATAGYTLPMPKGGEAKGGAVASADGFSFAKVATALAKANVESGKEVFKACTQCHTPEKGGANKRGPNLWGIVGRDVGKLASFTNYSPAMSGKGGKWDWAALTAYLNDPRGTIPGNRMSYAGIKDVAEMADLLAYLNTIGDAPVALPAVPAEGAKQ